jgi:beta-glucosidase-like glycosyl hydrolase
VRSASSDPRHRPHRTSHAPRRYEAALQSFVLLKNGPPPSTSSASVKESVPLLPLKIGSKIAVLGPQAVAREGLLEDYAADQQVPHSAQLFQRDSFINTELVLWRRV